MAEALIGGAFLSAFLQVLFDRMASREVVDFVCGRKVNSGLLKKLKLTLLSINSVLDDAEEKQFTSPTVNEWLDELKDAVYNAEDLVDEIATEASREAQVKTHSSQEWSFMSSAPSLFDKDVESRLKETLETLEYIANQKDVLGLRERVVRKQTPRLPTTCLIDESCVYGRDDEKEAIFNTLLSDDVRGKKIGVVAIVGMGGVGKTTLAQLVYNDSKVNDCFDLKAWVCVSEEFDVFRVTKTALEAITSRTCDIKDLNLLQVKLKENLTGKKFLVVLDDVWNENYVNWEVLQSPFLSGAQGSKVIVTTRNANVASIMQTLPTHHLKQLSDDDSWLLFVKHAFDGIDSTAYPKLKATGREIVKKCKGLPLALKTLGGLLRSKRNLEEWNEISQSEIWDLPDDVSNILLALRLSYLYLPSNLKRCFAYCSIFPNNHEFKREELILMWMAEDFLRQPKGKKRMEDVGEEYFNYLVSKSFFQQSSSDKSRFVMHDLIKDLAKSVSGDFCLCFRSESSHKFVRKTRHMSYMSEDHDKDFQKFEAFYEAKGLRSLLHFSSESFYTRTMHSTEAPDDLWLKLRCLRVLSLSGYLINKLPDSIGNLKHLRYLDISGSAIEKLPDALCSLFNLQTLLLLGCFCLAELPANMGRLTNLRYLYISGAMLDKMPFELSKLKDLQVLTEFIVGKNEGCGIKELGQFQDLHGALTISGLQNVVNIPDTLKANLKDKKHLRKLIFRWAGSATDSQIVRKVLDMLQPHRNLGELIIEQYWGTRFPDWLGNQLLSNLVSLSLCKCNFCLLLPPLGQLPFLKDLSITGMNSVVSVGQEFYGNSSSAVQPFQSLEILRFEKMNQWQEWLSPKGEYSTGVFPCLQELLILDCPNLAGDLPAYLPSLTKLWIHGCQLLAGSLPRAPAMRGLHLSGTGEVLLMELPPLLHSFRIEGYHHLESLPIQMTHITTCIETLSIYKCSSLVYYSADGLPSTLKELEIMGCRKFQFLIHDCYKFLSVLTLDCSCDSLESFPFDLFPKLGFLELQSCMNLESFTFTKSSTCHELTSLKTLQILNCPNFVSFPNGGLPAPNLGFLMLAGCEKLKSLPDRMHDLLQSLEHLAICECFELEKVPEGGLPSNLISFEIQDCDRLVQRQEEWDLQTLTSLSSLVISSAWEGLESYPEEGMLPSSLKSLRISGFPNLRNLNGMELQRLTSLRHLRIDRCREIQCLPEEGLPSSLLSLTIFFCPILARRCQKDKGEDWPKITHIPDVDVL